MREKLNHLYLDNHERTILLHSLAIVLVVFIGGAAIWLNIRSKKNK